MKINKFILLPVCFTSSILFVFSLFKISDRLNHLPSSFVRFIYPHKWRNHLNLDVKYNSYYIAGLSKNNIYLGNETAPLQLLISNYKTDTQTIHLKIDSYNKLKFRGIKIVADSPFFYLYEGNSGHIIVGSLLNFSEISIDSTKFHFNRFLSLKKGLYITRTISDSIKKNILIKESVFPDKKQYYVFQKQKEGIFSVDGMLNYDKASNKLVYVYFYRNQFIALDTNLNELHVFNTIDTNTIAKINVSSIKSENITVLSTPPLTVNKRSCSFGDTLYINSKLKARNEEEDYFTYNSVIDMYSLSSGKYLNSFYLPDLFGSKVKSFKIYNNYLVALYEHHLVVFTLN